MARGLWEDCIFLVTGREEGGELGLCNIEQSTASLPAIFTVPQLGGRV